MQENWMANCGRYVLLEYLQLYLHTFQVVSHKHALELYFYLES